MSLRRVFRAVQNAAGRTSQHHPIKVVTYNILAARYSGLNAAYAEEKHVAWTNRKLKIQEELAEYDADVVCLQEVETGAFNNELRPWMAERGFAGWFWARNFEEAGPGEPEGVALFYRTSLFAPLAHTAAPFTQAGPQPPIPGGARRQKGDVWWHWQQRGEGMVAAALRHLPSNQTCVVASTHLYWHPNYPDIKALQAAAMAHQLADFMRSHTGGTAAPLIACGDFNSLWRKYVSDEFDTVPLGGFCVSGVYELLSTGSLAPWHADHPASRRRRGEPPCPPDLQAPLAMPAGLRLASAQMLAHGREPLLTHKTNRFAGCLDYIWITPDCLEVAETLAMPYEEPEDLSMIPLALPFGPIPNEAFGSDHLALGAVLLLKTPPAST